MDTYVCFYNLIEKIILHSYVFFFKYIFKQFTELPSKGKEECKDQESIQSSTTPDPRHQNGKVTDNKYEHHTQEGQDVIYFLADDAQGWKEQTL